MPVDGEPPLTVRIRPLMLPFDTRRIESIDTSFETRRVFRLGVDGLTARLDDVELERPVVRDFGRPSAAELASLDHAVVAEDRQGFAGIAGARHEPWNRRAVMWHLYVVPSRRRSGVGGALLDSVIAFAHSRHARCVWLETPSSDYPAIRFYLAQGFRFCGFDESLYDPAGPLGGEVAVYFVLDLRSSTA